MDKPTILKTLVWLRRKHQDQENEVTLYNLFAQACMEQFHVRDEPRIQSDLEKFEHSGDIPMHVLRFVRKICACHFVPQRQRKGDKSCISAH